VNDNNINRLVAERVMGYQFWREQRGDYRMILLVTDGREPWKKRRQECWEEDGKRYQKIAASDIDTRHDCPTEGVQKWNPTRDTNQAMEVAAATIDKLPPEYRDGADFSLQKWGDWEAYFGTNKEDHNRGLATHANPATAICLAALRAVGVSEEEVNRE
jgi:hypothetical protein